ncbi:hypothetical protein OKW96_14155 [Sphingobacterium sp. KU25419]|nr:hypothetical protein OKW96_14155 [Sphingobacterium sp. KU25419]
MTKIYFLGILVSIYFLSAMSSCQSGEDIKTAQYAVNGQKYISITVKIVMERRAKV